ncbi:hypothetical protein M427DRAFT_295654 [Gonapodya prolifera JEL478]|uniref:Uncharacterized protein n=1 Tax=Gonapodya prolifera (strain JEL478) TaxID=1344416 RepID=A0A139AHP1_GONPJ|nr:hypothetical protein M427DRAFT_295654 [Gonapodya prolifera JEL478]|eukprot:KXS16280.1 hypothetical protein M427DRAFT_295654 [Gonapodya prolifera JEL478]
MHVGWCHVPLGQRTGTGNDRGGARAACGICVVGDKSWRAHCAIVVIQGQKLFLLQRQCGGSRVRVVERMQGRVEGKRDIGGARAEQSKRAERSNQMTWEASEASRARAEREMSFYARPQMDGLFVDGHAHRSRDQSTPEPPHITLFSVGWAI